MKLYLLSNYGFRNKELLYEGKSIKRMKEITEKYLKENEPNDKWGFELYRNKNCFAVMSSLTMDENRLESEYRFIG